MHASQASQTIGSDLNHYNTFEGNLVRMETKESIIKCTLVNCWSVVNKRADLQNGLIENNFTLCALTETWIRLDDDVTWVQLCPPGYKVISKSRKDKTGGGIAVVYRDTPQCNAAVSL